MFGFKANKDTSSEEQKTDRFCDIKHALPTFLFFVLTVLFFECLLHFIINNGFYSRLPYLIGFSLPIGTLIFLICNLFSRKVNLILSWIALALLYIIFIVQFFYSQIFGSYLSVFLFQQGGQAITGFWAQLSAEIIENIWLALLFALPLPVFAVLLKFKVINLDKRKPNLKLYSLIAVFVLHIICLLCLFIGGTKPYSAYNVYFGTDTDTDRSAKNFGIITTMRLELTYIITGKDIDMEIIENNDPNDTPSQTDPTPNPISKYNIIEEINFEALNKKTTNSSILTLNNYLATKTGTKTNKYTGMFKNKNLIVLCCESFSPHVIDPQLTPTLYKLSTEGFVFNNFYNCYPNNTTNGEYTLCMGIFPDFARSKSNGSFKFSSDNYLPYCLGRMFEQNNIKSYAYHNYKGNYYSREDTHPNMGYSTFKSAGDGMEFTTSWPTSDLEMMQQSIDDYIDQEQFHAYYMTFSGHYKYNFTTNPMCIRNYDKVKDLPYSEAVQAYIACNLELEYALEYLMGRLEEKGIADDTVIVLTNDHYPYGLTDEEYNELAGKEIDTAFEKYKNSFICWSGDMEHPVYVDDYCCSVDILPTILNLFGMRYDSRLLVGTDIFSDSTKLVILSDQSFITDKLMFNSSTGEATYLVDPSTLKPDYLETAIKAVKNKITVSSLILNTDYYRFIYENTFPEIFGITPEEKLISSVSSQTTTQDTPPATQ